MARAIQALLRSLLGVLHPKMLLFTLLPFLFAGVLWGFLGIAFWDEWTALFRTLLTESEFGSLVRWMVSLTGVDLSLVLPPLLGMLILVPLVVGTALLLIAVLGMPLILKHVAKRHYPDLELRKGGSWLASAGNGLLVTVVLVVGWLLCLPLWLIPMVGPIVPLVLLGWATAKVFSYDALAEHADAQESVAIRQTHRWPLFGLGVMLAMFGSVPTLLWLGGALVVLMLPVMALLSVWLYGAVFVLSGLAFAHFCLAELARLRRQSAVQLQQHSLLQGAEPAT
jgi:Etoposide-induced protein 2.4 (EI24)